jgi:hypothetical protein
MTLPPWTTFRSMSIFALLAAPVISYGWLYSLSRPRMQGNRLQALWLGLLGEQPHRVALATDNQPVTV